MTWVSIALCRQVMIEFVFKLQQCDDINGFRFNCCTCLKMISSSNTCLYLLHTKFLLPLNLQFESKKQTPSKLLQYSHSGQVYFCEILPTCCQFTSVHIHPFSSIYLHIQKNGVFFQEYFLSFQVFSFIQSNCCNFIHLYQ